MGEMINIGDTVDVWFEYTEREFNLTVISKPVATGDCWILKRQDGTPVYVQNYSKIVKGSKRP